MVPRDQFHWYALTVKPRHEKATAQLLRLRELEEFLPLQRVQREWSDRTQTVDLPLFPGYLFCRFGYKHRLRVLNTPGVRSIVGFAATDVPVAEETVHALQTLVASGRFVEPQAFLRPGANVRVTEGPLKGVRGTLVREKGAWRVVVNIELLQRSVAVEIDRALLSHST
jgi:transcription antitermination factor NusG